MSPNHKSKNQSKKKKSKREEPQPKSPPDKENHLSARSEEKFVAKFENVTNDNADLCAALEEAVASMADFFTDEDQPTSSGHNITGSVYSSSSCDASSAINNGRRSSEDKNLHSAVFDSISPKGDVASATKDRLSHSQTSSNKNDLAAIKEMLVASKKQYRYIKKQLRVMQESLDPSISSNKDNSNERTKQVNMSKKNINLVENQVYLGDIIDGFCESDYILIGSGDWDKEMLKMFFSGADKSDDEDYPSGVSKNTVENKRPAVKTDLVAGMDHISFKRNKGDDIVTKQNATDNHLRSSIHKLCDRRDHLGENNNQSDACKNQARVQMSKTGAIKKQFVAGVNQPKSKKKKKKSAQDELSACNHDTIVQKGHVDQNQLFTKMSKCCKEKPSIARYGGSSIFNAKPSSKTVFPSSSKPNSALGLNQTSTKEKESLDEKNKTSSRQPAPCIVEDKLSSGEANRETTVPPIQPDEFFVCTSAIRLEYEDILNIIDESTLRYIEAILKPFILSEDLLPMTKSLLKMKKEILQQQGKGGLSKPCALLPLHRDKKVIMNLFVLDPKACIPMHSHPGSVGVVRVLSGSISVRPFNLLSESHERLIRKTKCINPKATLCDRRSEVIVKDPKMLWMFLKTVGNVHEIQARDEVTVIVEANLCMDGEIPSNDSPLAPCHFMYRMPTRVRCVELEPLNICIMCQVKNNNVFYSIVDYPFDVKKAPK